MLRKLTVVLWMLLVLCACQPEAESTIYVGHCEYVEMTGGEIDSLSSDEVYLVRENGDMRMISQWLERDATPNERTDYGRFKYCAPYLFHEEYPAEDAKAWQLIGTTPEGAEPQVWLSSDQLPESLQENTTQLHQMELVDQTLYIPSVGEESFLVAARIDAPPELIPLGEGLLLLYCDFADGQFYYLDHTTLMALDLATCERRALASTDQLGPLYGSLFHVEKELLWFHTLASPAENLYSLCAVNVNDGSVALRRKTDFLGENGVYIHDGYLYYLTKSEHWTGGEWGMGARLNNLWELPLSAVMKDAAGSWEDLTAAHASLLADDVAFDQYSAVQELLFGAHGLWICYPPMPTMLDLPYGRSFYYAYAH